MSLKFYAPRELGKLFCLTCKALRGKNDELQIKNQSLNCLLLY